jgi:hypothetical protein
VVAAASAETGDEPDWLENNKSGFVWRHHLASGLGQNMGIWQNLGPDSGVLPAAFALSGH